MQSYKTSISDVIVIKPTVFEDTRGFFFESFNQKIFEQQTGVNAYFVQDNHSRSEKGVIRGLHYQIQQAQGKLIRVMYGEIYDVVVDLRKKSPTFGHWVSEILSAKNHKQLWVPEGFAHGFLVLSDVAEIIYKTTDYYAPKYECTLKWDDPDINVSWPLTDLPIMSEKDKQGLAFRDCFTYE